MFYERTIEKTIRSVSAAFPVMLVTGPRQVGKTTLLEKIAERTYEITQKGGLAAARICMAECHNASL